MTMKNFFQRIIEPKKGKLMYFFLVSYAMLKYQQTHFAIRWETSLQSPSFESFAMFHLVHDWCHLRSLITGKEISKENCLTLASEKVSHLILTTIKQIESRQNHQKKSLRSTYKIIRSWVELRKLMSPNRIREDTPTPDEVHLCGERKWRRLGAIQITCFFRWE